MTGISDATGAHIGSAMPLDGNRWGFFSDRPTRLFASRAAILKWLSVNYPGFTAWQNGVCVHQDVPEYVPLFS